MSKYTLHNIEVRCPLMLLEKLSSDPSIVRIEMYYFLFLYISIVYNIVNYL